MKRRWRILLTVAILGLQLTACQPETPHSTPAIGKTVTLMENNTVKIDSAQIEDGKITVVLDLDFQDLALSDLKAVYVQRLEMTAPCVSFDEAQAIADNPEPALTQPHSGKVTLTFLHESFSSEYDGVEYRFVMKREQDGVDYDTRISLYGAK